MPLQPSVGRGPGSCSDELSRLPGTQSKRVFQPVPGLEPLEPRLLLSGVIPGQEFEAPASAVRSEVVSAVVGNEVVFQEQTQLGTFFTPNVVSFDFTIDPLAVNARIDIIALSDVDGISENVSFDAEGIVLTELFTGLDDGLRPFTATINLDNADTAALAADGNLHIEFTPNSNVNDFGDVDEYITVGLTYEIESVSIPLSPIDPFDAGIYIGSVAGSISSVDEVDRFSVDLELQQTIRFELVPSLNQSLSMELLDPTGAIVLAGVSSAPGEPVMMQSIAVANPGRYTLLVTSSDGSGDYSVSAIVNQGIEEESVGGPSNNTIETAQSLDNLFVDIGDGIDRASVVGTYTYYIPYQTPLPKASFEDGLLGSDWTLSSSTADGSIEVTADHGAAEGSYALVMDSSGTTNNLNEAVWTVDLSGYSHATLSFAYTSWETSTTTLPMDYSGSVNGDGVSISDDGVNWHRMTYYMNTDPGEWQRLTYDLEQEAAEAGITLGPNIQIKFQQYGYGDAPNSGRAYDDIRLDASNLPESDHYDCYSFTLNENQLATIRTHSLNGPLTRFSLYDPQGNYLASYQANLENFKAPGAGEYTILVTQQVWHSYQLSVIRGAGDEFNPWLTKPLGAQIGASGALAGMIEEIAGEDTYLVSAVGGDQLTIRTVTPNDGESGLNQLDPLIRLFDPTGAEVAFDDNSDTDGRNATLTYTALMTGDYEVQVTAADGTTGEYLLIASGQTGFTPNPFEAVFTTLEDGELTRYDHSYFSLSFTSDALRTSIDTSDMLLNGQQASSISSTSAGGVTYYRFYFDEGVEVEGENTVEIPAGTVRDLYGTYTSIPITVTYTLDSEPPKLIESSVLEGDVIPEGELILVLRFNEPVSLDSIYGWYRQVELEGTRTGLLYASAVYDTDTDELTLTYQGLTEDEYSFTLFDSMYLYGNRYEIVDQIGNIFDGEADPLLTVPTGDGAEGGAFTLNFGVDDGITTPIDDTLESDGVFSMRAEFEGRSDYIGDEDRFSIDVKAGNTLTIAPFAQDPGIIQPEVDLLGPGGELLATTAGTGQRSLNMVPITADGTHTIVIRTMDGVQDYFSGKVLINAAIETESVTGQSNGDISVAQDIDGLFRVEDAHLQQAVIHGNVQHTVLAESFEDFDFTNGWSKYYTGWSSGYARANGVDGAPDGDRALLMSRSITTPNYTNVSVSWSGDLSYLQDAILSFACAEWGSESTTELPDTFTGYVDGDGISIGNLNELRKTIFTPPATSSGVWQYHTVNLMDKAEQAGITLGDRFILRIQQYGYGEIPSHGRGFDDIRILGTTGTAGEPDLYRVTLDVGESLSVTLDTSNGFGPDIEVLDATGQVLVSNGGAWLDAVSSIRGFVADAAGTYYIRVPETSYEYSLIVNKGSAFTPEPGNSSVHVDLTSIGAHASIFDAAESDRYRLYLSSADTVTVWTESPSSLQPVGINTLDTYLKLYDPDGNLVAETGSGGEGLNALLSYTALDTGYYQLQVWSENETTGIYTLNASGMSRDEAPLMVVSSTSEDGDLTNYSPTTFTVNFNSLVRLDTVDAGDFTVDGFAATSVTVPHGDRLVFEVPVTLDEGPHVFELDNSALRSVSGDLMDAPFVINHTIDTIAPRIIYSSIQEGDVIDPGKITVAVRFDEEVTFDERYFNSTYSSIKVYAPGGYYGRPVEYLGYDPETSELMFSFVANDEGIYSLDIMGSVRYGIEDLAQNALDGETPSGTLPPEVSGDGEPGGTFTISFTVDRVTTKPMTVSSRVTPTDSSVVRFTERGEILDGDPDDVDPFSVFVQPGQVVTAIVRSANGTPDNTPWSVQTAAGSATSPGGGEPAVLTFTHTGPAQDVVFNVSADTTGGGYYILDVYLNATTEQALPQVIVGADQAADIESAFVHLPGSDVDVATVIGSGQLSNAQTRTGISGGSTSQFNFDGQAEPTADATLSIVAWSDLDLADEYLHITGESLFEADVFVERDTLTSIVYASLTIPLATLQAMAADGTINFSVTPSYEVDWISDSGMTVALTYPGGPEPIDDLYAVNLAKGQSISVVLDSDVGGHTFELIDAGSGEVVAGGSSGEGFTQVLSSFTATTSGQYLLRVHSVVEDEYHLAVTRGALLHAAGVDDATQVVNLDAVDAAMGYLGAEPGRLFSFDQFDEAMIYEYDPYTFTRSGLALAVDTSLLASSSLSSLAFDGQTIYVGTLPDYSDGYTSLLAYDVDSGELVGSYEADVLFNTTVEDVAAFGDRLVTFDSQTMQLLLVDPDDPSSLTQIDVDIEWDSYYPLSVYWMSIAGAYSRGSVFLTFNRYPYDANLKIYEVDATSGQLLNTFAVSPSSYSTSSDINSLAYLDGRLYVTSQYAESITAYDVNTGELLAREGTIGEVGGGDAAWMNQPDTYSVTLYANQQVTLSTLAPFDEAGGPSSNNLDPVLRVFDPEGNEIAMDNNSAADGKNAILSLTATVAGSYTIEVSAVSGTGEYLLQVDREPYLAGDLDGDGFVGLADLDIVLGNWNQAVPIGDLAEGDVSGDGFVGLDDLDVLLGNWNATLEPPTLEGDLNKDGYVGLDDLDIVLGNWNTDGSADDRSDPTHDGYVGLADLDIVLANWNVGTPPMSIELTAFIQQSVRSIPLELTLSIEQAQAESPSISTTSPATNTKPDSRDHQNLTRTKRMHSHKPTPVDHTLAYAKPMETSPSPHTQVALDTWQSRQRPVHQAVGQTSTPRPSKRDVYTSPLGLWEDAEIDL